MWENILKVKQITTPTTDVNIKKVPKKSKKPKGCCKEAYDAWVILCKDVLEEYKKTGATENAKNYWEALPARHSFERDTWFSDKLEEEAPTCREFYEFLNLHEYETIHFTPPESLLPLFFVPRLTKILENWRNCGPNDYWFTVKNYKEMLEGKQRYSTQTLPKFSVLERD